MASLDDLTAATEELSALAQMHLQPPLLCQLTFTLPGPQLLPVHQGELQPHSSPGKTNLTHGETISPLPLLVPAFSAC